MQQMLYSEIKYYENLEYYEININLLKTYKIFTENRFN